ncbi:uroporphyrinogen-III C-methyltransferase [Pseudomonas sp. CFBP 13602]|uniref:uroporphyrinogen-III C-methyltransferase n=1 Tax=Pseudomonas sp. CFBP 13602 TaxID=2774039 RepID=UPI001786B29E|nr:uroporphyrinogen-III C-methyltransferase [Pseudomonas sp. CFBP 13602]
MSETALPKDEPKSAPQVPFEQPAALPPQRSANGNGLAIIALLLAAAGLAAAGWGVWQVRTLTAGHQQQSRVIEGLATQTLTLEHNERQLSADLAQLPDSNELEDRHRLLAQLQGDQQRLSQRLETVLGASRKDWRLAEAEHLLRLASLRLSALQDVTSAKALVQGADEILREQDDPQAFAAREQLTRSLASLQGTTQPDRTGLFLQLSALREQATQLTALAPEFQAAAAAAQGNSPEGETRLRQWWNKISGFFRVDFSPDDSIRPLLAGQSLSQVRLALSLALEQAQWAALNGQGKVYTQALDDARSILVAGFNRENGPTQAMIEQLTALKNQPVSVTTPDLDASLNAIQAYLQHRHTPVEGLQKSTEAAPAAVESQP